MFKNLLGLISVVGIASALPEKDFDSFTLDWFTQRQDHFDKSNRNTWQQRYWVSDQFGDDTAPVFVYICGESECHKPSDHSFYMNMADEFKAKVYSVEHRYYGQSQPVPDWSTENMKFLDSQQALEDLAVFIQNLKDQDASPRKYLVIGGSYPGALSAWFRYKYPHLADFSWSSSGVINAVTDMWQQDEIVYKDTLKSGQFCPDKINEFTAFIEKPVVQAMEGGPSEMADTMIGLFKGDGIKYDEFLFFSADMFIAYVQYGQRTELCDKLKQAEDIHGMDLVQFIAQNVYQGGIEVYKTSELQKTTILHSNNYRQWTWQYCNEFGFFQTPSHEHPMRSEYVGINFWTNYCRRIFEFSDYVAPYSYQTNAHYGAKNLKTSYTIFVNGGEDVWVPASMTAFPDPAYAKANEMVNLLADCDDCGHCGELRTPNATTDPTELTQVRDTIKSTLHRWLDAPKDFTQHFY
jgi:pimeloyl-ACP methyl ester carboxylesterase